MRMEQRFKKKPKTYDYSLYSRVSGGGKGESKKGRVRTDRGGVEG